MDTAMLHLITICVDSYRSTAFGLPLIYNELFGLRGVEGEVVVSTPCH